MSDRETVINELRALGCDEAYQVTTYRAHSDNGSEITLEVHDSGIDGPYRYSVSAHDEAGKEDFGNPMATVREALSEMHWGRFGMAY